MASTSFLYCLAVSTFCVSMCVAGPTARNIQTRAATSALQVPSNQNFADLDTTELVNSGINVGDVYPSKGTGPLRVTRVYSRNSKKFIRVTNTTIDGKGYKTDIDARLLLEGVGHKSQIRIKSARWGYFLCLNKNGSVIPLPPAQGKTQDQCVFYQDQVHGYTVFQSKLNQNWFLGITKDGSPKTARKTTSNQRATHFIEY